jgi:hypothetical protein
MRLSFYHRNALSDRPVWLKDCGFPQDAVGLAHVIEIVTPVPMMCPIGLLPE